VRDFLQGYFVDRAHGNAQQCVGSPSCQGVELEFKNKSFSGDVFMQAVGSYLNRHKAPTLLERTCPSVLICIEGPHAAFFCAVFTGHTFLVDPLISLSLLPSPYDPDLINSVARVLAATTKKAAIAIDESNKTGNKHQQGFPYKSTRKPTNEEQQEITFKYTGYFAGKDTMFTAD